jgi:hypothetical protein
MNKAYKIFYKNAHFIVATIGMCFPVIVLYYTHLKIKKLDRGIEKDLERIKQKGKKYSDIPKYI